MGTRNSNPGGAAAEGLSRIGRVSTAPSESFESGESPGGSGGSGGGLWDRISGFLRGLGGSSSQTPPSPAEEHGTSDDATKLPDRRSNAARQAWESLDPIAPRGTGDACPSGNQDLGVILFVHDVESKRRDFATRSNTDQWQAVHTISDLIEALRALVGDCNCVRGIMISAHGGSGTDGGFRMGDDTDGDGEIDGTEALDMVSSQAQAQKFGDLIKGAFCNRSDAFISIESCSSSGSNNKFIRKLHDATGVITIGSPDSANVGGNFWSCAWWEADGGRTQINRDGTLRTNAATEGTNVWEPF